MESEGRDKRKSFFILIEAAEPVHLCVCVCASQPAHPVCVCVCVCWRPHLSAKTQRLVLYVLTFFYPA